MKLSQLLVLCLAGKSKYEQLADKISECKTDECRKPLEDEYERIYLKRVTASMGTSKQDRRDGEALIRASKCMDRRVGSR